MRRWVGRRIVLLMSLEALIKEAESLSAEERKQLLSAVAMIDAPYADGASKDAISELIANPIKVPGFRPLSREEANVR